MDESNLTFTMSWFLFILLNAFLFIRPAELSPAFEVPVYNYLMISCLAVSAAQIVTRVPRLSRTPIAACVLGVPVAAVLSHLSHMYFYGVAEAATTFFKLMSYYVVLVTVVDTLGRLRSFLRWLVIFTLVLTAIAVLSYESVIEIPSLEVCRQNDIDPQTEEAYILPRLCSTGIFNDPNDLSMILVMSILVALYFVESQRGFLRLLWCAPIAVFGYALKLTYSRGGLLNLASGLFFLSLARLGAKRTALACVVAFPVLLVLFGGRQTRFDLSTSSDTSQGRIQIWAEGLALLRQSPLFGIGLDEYAEKLGHVAHNSFVQTYVELGFFGGTLFAGAFYTSILGISRLVRHSGKLREPEVERLGPYLVAIIGSFCVGLFSLTRTEAVPTYLVLGIATVYLQIASTQCSSPPLKLDSRFIQRLCAFSVVWLVFLHIFTRLMVRWG